MPAPTPEQRAAVRVRPARPPSMFQSWNHLLFLHWRRSAAEIQSTLPEGLFVDTFDGHAYLGAVPFWMDRVRPRFCPPVPGLSWFLELNLRTYVHTADGTPGVWFYSLDCNNPAAVRIARRFFHLPYVDARQRGVRPDGPAPSFADFSSQRAGGRAADRFVYAGTTPPAPAAAGSLEYFLAERYVLFSRNRRSGRLYEGRVWHRPYLLSPARVTCAETALFEASGFAPPGRPADHAMMSPGVDVAIHGLRPVAT